MKYTQHILFCDDVEVEDEIDELFSKLQTIEPPPSLVDAILTSVAQLPAYSPMHSALPNILHDTEGPVVWHDHGEPS